MLREMYDEFDLVSGRISSLHSASGYLEGLLSSGGAGERRSQPSSGPGDPATAAGPGCGAGCGRARSWECALPLCPRGGRPCRLAAMVRLGG